MSCEPSIVAVRSLTKRFKQYPTPAARLAEWLSFGTLRRHSLFTALDDISFDVRKGEFFGIVGPNGSGKSTLLKVLTSILMPTSGSFSISGRVTSLLELGTGFNPELSGRENLINSGRLLGFEVAQTRRRMDQIIDFAELGEQIDLPIKYYSTGMVVRLAFALFAHIEPDVFIVDEALSVGDIGFSRKCFARLDSMRESGCTLLFVSHDLAAVRKYCDQAMFLFHGKCAYLGSANEATDIYVEAMSPGGRARGLGVSAQPDAGDRSPSAQALFQQMPDELASSFDQPDFERIAAVRSGRLGTGTVRIVAIRTADERDRPRSSFTVGDVMRCHILARASDDFDHATVSCQLVNRMGVGAWGTNHALHTGQTTSAHKGQWLHATFEVKLDVAHDQYAIDVGWGDASGKGHVFDRITAVTSIVVSPGIHMDFIGVARLKCQTSVTSSGTGFQPVSKVSQTADPLHSETVGHGQDARAT
jgi:ABC-type polysaccharide/polyol phosphate transport system ATPase subunit